MGAIRRSAPATRSAVQLGRAHERPAELHYTSGDDRWWYHGGLWVTETRAVRGSDVDPDLTDPRNVPIIRRLEEGWSDEQVAAFLVDPRFSVPTAPGTPPPVAGPRFSRALAIARRLRWARDHASDPHTVRFYGFRHAAKDEERVLATVDQDLLADAPTIRYTETQKGARRQQVALLLGLGIAYAVLLFSTFSFMASPSLSVESAQQASAQLVNSAGLAGMIAAIPVTGLGVWWWVSRRTYVLDVEIQPLIGTTLDDHTEPVFLTNSTKTPVSMYVSHVLRLPTDGIDALAAAIRTFQTDTIALGREQIASLRSQLDDSKIAGLVSLTEELDLRSLGGRRASPLPSGMGIGTLALVVAIAVASTVGIILALGPPGGL